MSAKIIAKELWIHAPYTALGTLSGIVIMAVIIWVQLPKNVSTALFWMLHLPNRGLHLGFIEKWWLVNPIALIGSRVDMFVQVHTSHTRATFSSAPGPRSFTSSWLWERRSTC